MGDSMSKVKIQGNASGTGVLTIEAPNTNTDRTITLPDSTGTLVGADASGNVGIGTSSPTNKLDVQTSAGKFSVESLGGGSIRLASDGSIGMNVPAGYAYEIDVGGSEVLRIDSSGNMGLGVVPESDWVSGRTSFGIGVSGAALSTSSTASNAQCTLSANAKQTRTSNTTGWDYTSTTQASQYHQFQGQHYFKVAPSGTADTAISWTTAMTINNNGNTLFGTANQSPAEGSTSGTRIGSNGKTQFSADATGDTVIMVNRLQNDGHLMQWRRNGTEKGSIAVSGSTISYNTSSDYRLKENLVPLTDSIERVKSLNVYRFNFIADADTTVDGFLAHEAGEVVPECATGEKDAMRTEEYEVTPAVMDGETVVTEAVMGEREVIDPQGIDQSKLVPLLAAALQDAIARIEALEA